MHVSTYLYCYVSHTYKLLFGKRIKKMLNNILNLNSNICLSTVFKYVPIYVAVLVTANHFPIASYA